MTDILLLGKHGTAVVNVSEECVVSIEVGMSKGPTFPALGCVTGLRRLESCWPVCTILAT